MPSSDAPLLALAQAVADGSRVDWDHAESSAGTPDERDAVRQLRHLAAVVATSRGQASTWGPLEIRHKVANGAFGTVYRAWDPSLNREVALKLLRRLAPAVSADLIAREGQLLARIQHPNVMSVYGAQILDGEVGIWGEFLRGRTLAEIVADSGPLSADETLVVADAICRALAAAHRAGLLHRDVKAQNVIREKGGRIVLMDFGLGREFQNDATGPVELAGTPLYLAPELFARKPASLRSDIYSVGVLMFYLATGSYPVTGKTLDEIAASHAAGRRQRLPDLRPDLPTAFNRVVERAIDPDPDARFESAGAMRAALAAASHGTRPEDARPAGISTRWRAAFAAAMVAAAILGGTATWLARDAPAPPPPFRFTIDAPPGTRFSDSSADPGTISPDGQHIIFSAANESTGLDELWLHSLRTMQTTVLPQSKGGKQAFWAPDSRSVAFFTGQGLKRITITGVRSDTVAAADEPRGGAWSRDGTILFTQGPRSGLYRVSASGEAAKASLLIEPDRSRQELGYAWPQFLPDGRRFLYFVLSNDENVRGIYLASLDGGPRTRLAASDASGIVAGSRLLFVRDGNLVAQPFDEASGRIAGEAARVIERVETSFDGRSAVTGSNDGSLVFSRARFSELNWYTAGGTPAGSIAVPRGRYRSPVLSRDGRYLAVQQYRDAHSRILVLDLVRGGTAAIFTRGIADRTSFDTQFAVWSPDSKLAYASSDNGWLDIYTAGLDSGDWPQLLLRSPADKEPTDWSSDGQFLAFMELSPAGSYDQWVLPMHGDRTPRVVLNTPSAEGLARFAPDSKRLAYVSTESGLLEVWVRSVAADDRPVRVSAAGGIDPAWPSNEHVSFLDLSGRLLVAHVPRVGDASPPASPSVRLVTRVVSPETSRNNYAWSPDGKRILVNEPALDNDVRIHVMLNWRNASSRTTSAQE